MSDAGVVTDEVGDICTIYTTYFTIYHSHIIWQILQIYHLSPASIYERATPPRVVDILWMSQKTYLRSSENSPKTWWKRKSDGNQWRSRWGYDSSHERRASSLPHDHRSFSSLSKNPYAKSSRYERVVRYWYIWKCWSREAYISFLTEHTNDTPYDSSSTHRSLYSFSVAFSSSNE